MPHYYARVNTLRQLSPGVGYNGVLLIETLDADEISVCFSIIFFLHVYASFDVMLNIDWNMTRISYVLLQGRFNI